MSGELGLTITLAGFSFKLLDANMRSLWGVLAAAGGARVRLIVLDFTYEKC